MTVGIKKKTGLHKLKAAESKKKTRLHKLKTAGQLNDGHDEL